MFGFLSVLLTAFPLFVFLASIFSACIQFPPSDPLTSLFRASYERTNNSIPFFSYCSVSVFYVRSISVTLVVKMPVIFFAISKGRRYCHFFSFGQEVGVKNMYIM